MPRIGLEATDVLRDGNDSVLDQLLGLDIRQPGSPGHVVDQLPVGVEELQNVATNQFLTVVESQSYPNASLQFSGVTSGPGGFRLSMTEPAAGATYILEASINLVNWTKLMARKSVGGTTQFTDTHSASFPSRYYRLQVP